MIGGLRIYLNYMIKALLNLFRWKNILIIFGMQICAFLFLRVDFLGQWEELSRFVLYSLSSLFIAAAGYVINDYSDVKIDTINKPDKLIVNTLISGRLSLFIYFGFNIIGLVLAGLVSRDIFIIHLMITFWLWRYSVDLKYRLFWGNFLVSLMMGLSLFLMIVSLRNMDVIWICFYSIFAFLTGFIREIVKDIEDMRGDELNGCRTIPIVYGLAKAKIILYYLISVTITLLIYSVFYLLQNDNHIVRSVVFSVIIAGGLVYPLVLTFRKIHFAQVSVDFYQVSKHLKWIMVIGILSMFCRILY